ncbi:hypothetical protein KP509_18G041200 [Ceratopteris richardii]|uniref:Uncharacterized protein n=1 Tax=Ceratopteris richardii TaxID=49495 RepID=A0A8T2SSS2_CERRI|nr:hypothetical protein KP509_18G041200 [Ceratopteris richardii]
MAIQHELPQGILSPAIIGHPYPNPYSWRHYTTSYGVCSNRPSPSTNLCIHEDKLLLLPNRKMLRSPMPAFQKNLHLIPQILQASLVQEANALPPPSPTLQWLDNAPPLPEDSTHTLQATFLFGSSTNLPWPVIPRLAKATQQAHSL